MTKIEWTEKSWNPIVGCSIVSPGCTNCYAMKMAARLEAMAGDGLDDNGYAVRGTHPLDHYRGTTKRSNAGPVWTGKVALAPDRALTEPLRRKKPTTWFVNSMGDLFHEDVPDEWIDRVFAVMALTPQHTYQVLTKRSGRMLAYVSTSSRAGAISEAHATFGIPFFDWPLPNVWLGVSTERQQEADERIPDLLATPAAVRFVSAEPLLGPIDFTFVGNAKGPSKEPDDSLHRFDAMTGRALPWAGVFGGLGVWSTNKALPCSKLNWVIVGGESGPGARPMHPDWARSIRDQCAAAGAPMFFKQWGAWEIASDQNGLRNGYAGHRMPDTGEKFTWLGYDGRTANPSSHDVGEPAYAMAKVGKTAAGRLLDGVEHNGFPAG